MPLTTLQLAAGTNTKCYNYANGNDIIYGYATVSDCAAAAWQYNATLKQLQDWNPTLHTKSANCTFDPHLRYCVWYAHPSAAPKIVANGNFTASTTATGARNFTIPKTTLSLVTPSSTTESSSASGIDTMTATSTTSVSAARSTSPPSPSPTQEHSIARNCNSYDKVSAGDGCSSFATDHKITPDQLYNWNSVLGINGTGCRTLLEVGLCYCTSVTTPSPMQNNSIPANCDVYAAAQSGDSCSGFATKNNVTTRQLFDWNTVLGEGGAECDQEFQAGMNYCIGINGQVSPS